MIFDEDCPMVYRPMKRQRCANPESKTDISNKRIISLINGSKTMKEKANIVWRPTYKHGVSATHTTQHSLNIPKDHQKGMPVGIFKDANDECTPYDQMNATQKLQKHRKRQQVDDYHLQQYFDLQ
jgi:putative lipase involved disintegration of autophagic bodies